MSYTWGRDAGIPEQEVGGVVVTLAALCQACGLDMMADTETEIVRIDNPDIIAGTREKHAAKPICSRGIVIPEK